MKISVSFQIPEEQSSKAAALIDLIVSFLDEAPQIWIDEVEIKAVPKEQTKLPQQDRSCCITIDGGSIVVSAKDFVRHCNRILSRPENLTSDIKEQLTVLLKSGVGSESIAAVLRVGHADLHSLMTSNPYPFVSQVWRRVFITSTGDDKDKTIFSTKLKSASPVASLPELMRKLEAEGYTVWKLSEEAQIDLMLAAEIFKNPNKRYDSATIIKLNSVFGSQIEVTAAVTGPANPPPLPKSEMRKDSEINQRLDRLAAALSGKRLLTVDEFDTELEKAGLSFYLLKKELNLASGRSQVAWKTFKDRERIADYFKITLSDIEAVGEILEKKRSYHRKKPVVLKEPAKETLTKASDIKLTEIMAQIDFSTVKTPQQVLNKLIGLGAGFSALKRLIGLASPSFATLSKVDLIRIAKHFKLPTAP